MSTIVFLHAHPDDEASQTSGSMARAVDEGHRVVVVFATHGDHGEAPDDLAPGETVVDRRRAEAEASAAAIGLHRVVWLGYADSGMTGWDQNSHEGAFTAAPLDEAGARFAAVLDEEDADIAVGYDWHGGYGHPDHVQVHRVLHRGRRPRRAAPPGARVDDEPRRRCAGSARRPGRPAPPTTRRSTPTSRWTTATRSASPSRPSPGGSTSPRGSSGAGPRSRRTAARPPTSG